MVVHKPADQWGEDKPRIFVGCLDTQGTERPGFNIPPVRHVIIDLPQRLLALPKQPVTGVGQDKAVRRPVQDAEA